MTVISDAPERGPGGIEAGIDRARDTWSDTRARSLAIAVAGVVVAGLVLRFFTTSDLWLDEALSVNVARLPLGELSGALKIDGAPPLFYVLLHAWTAVLGTSDLAVRSLSGVFAVATLPLAWFAGRRAGGRVTAWTAVVVLAANPFAIRYATEARMYGLEILLVFAGILAFRRALEQPTWPRVALVGAIVALLAYCQYWAFYLIAVAGVLLVGLALRGPHKAAARRMLIGFALGGLAFLPWVPTFLYQSAHTGTPWGQPVLPGAPIGKTLSDFAGSTEHEGWLLLFPMTALMFLGVFASAPAERRIELDLHTRPEVRWEGLVGLATLLVGTSVAYLTGGAFQTRYSAVVFPFYVIVVARGLSCFADRRVMAGVGAVVVSLGFVGGGRNVVESRTQAGDVAAVLRAEAAPGDVVVYCPDQVGPSTHRRAPSGLDEVTYPFFGDPERVDWVDYKERLATVEPEAFAEQVLDRAGREHAIWLVAAPGYTTHVGTCEAVAATLGAERTGIVKVVPDEQIFEKPGLTLYPVP